MNLKNREAAIEAILFAAGEPIEIERIAEAVELEQAKCEQLIGKISERYSDERSGLEVVKLDGSYQICTKGRFYEEIKTALKLRNNAVLSDVAMETLAIIAYNQPVTRSFLEDVRGVDCSYIIGTLCEKKLVEERGRLEIPGRPLLYGTTDNFLRCFNLSSLEDLPKLPRLEGEEDPDQMTFEEYTEQMEAQEDASSENE